jgi:hypothetical protein
MHKLLGSMVFLCALPLAAAAAPVDIVTRSTGTMQPDADVLAFLGLSAPPDMAAQPYTLTLRATLDPDAAGFRDEPWRSGVAQSRTQVSVTFAFGQQHLTFRGLGDVFLGGGGAYLEQVTFPPADQDGTRSFDIVNYVAVVGQAFDKLLAPPVLTDVDSRGTLSGAGFQTYIDPLTPRGLVSMNGQALSVSIDAVSPVPEPGRTTMMAGGLLALLGMAWRRRGR